jgi:hypothetical protein
VTCLGPCSSFLVMNWYCSDVPLLHAGKGCLFDWFISETSISAGDLTVVVFWCGCCLPIVCDLWLGFVDCPELSTRLVMGYVN